MESGDRKPKSVPKSQTPGLWMRTRRNSFPPLGGCLSRHGLGYWSTCVSNPTGPVSSINGSAFNLRVPELLAKRDREQSTQTDSSYIMLLKARDGRRDRERLARSISELVRKGRRQTDSNPRKRKIPSTIQIAQVKRKRKSRIRRRRSAFPKPVRKR